MSRLPPPNERGGYQPVPPQQSGGSGLFDRRSDRSPRPSQGYPQTSAPPSYNDRQSTSSSSSHNPGLLSRFTGGARDPPRVQGGVFRVLKVFVTIPDQSNISGTKARGRFLELDIRFPGRFLTQHWLCHHR